MSTGQLILILVDKEEKVKGKKIVSSNKLSHLGLTRICYRTPLGGRTERDAQVRTNIYFRGLPGELPLPCRISGIFTEYYNWVYFSLVPCSICRRFLHCVSHKEGHTPRKLKKPGRGTLRAWHSRKLHYWKIVESYLILKHDLTYWGLERGPIGAGLRITTSMVQSSYHLRRHHQRDCISIDCWKHYQTLGWPW